MISKNRLTWVPIMFLLVVILAPLGRISYSSPATIIRVQPSMLYAEPDEYFTIDVEIVGGVDVYAWQINMSYDPSVLRLVNATLPPDHFLEGRPEGTSQLWVYTLEGSVLLSCTIIGDYLGMHGGGVLASLEFETLGLGESVLKIEDVGEDTVLLDHFLVETSPGPELEIKDGYVSNIDHPPVASFTLSPTEPQVNATVSFDASASNDPDGDIVRYDWDFGDGTYANETDPTTTHVFTELLVYTVTLVVIDNANVTQEMMDALNTTAIPRIWYEIYSSYSREIAIEIDHDVAVTSVDASPRTVAVGEPVTLSVIVENQGNEVETFDLTAYYDGSTAATMTGQTLASAETKTLQLTWDTTDVAPDTYVIRAEAILEGDQDPDDNMFQDGTVRVEEPQASFPMEYVAIGIVAIVVLIAVYLILRKRGTSAT